MLEISDPSNFPTDTQSLPLILVQTPYKAPNSRVYLEPPNNPEPFNVYRLARALDNDIDIDDDPIAVYSLKKDGDAPKELKKILIDPKTGIILTEIQVNKASL